MKRALKVAVGAIAALIAMAFWRVWPWLSALAIISGAAVILRLSRKAEPNPARHRNDELEPATMNVAEIQQWIIVIGLEVFFPFGGKEQALLPGCLDIVAGKTMWRDVRMGLRFMGVNHRLASGIPEPDDRSSMANPESEERKRAFEWTIISLCHGLRDWEGGIRREIVPVFPATELTSHSVPEMRYWRGRWQELGGRLYQRTRIIAAKGDPIWYQISELGLPFPPLRIACGVHASDVGLRTSRDLKIPSAPPPSPLRFDPEKFRAALSAALERAINKHPAGRGMLD